MVRLTQSEKEKIHSQIRTEAAVLFGNSLVRFAERRLNKALEQYSNDWDQLMRVVNKRKITSRSAYIAFEMLAEFEKRYRTETLLRSLIAVQDCPAVEDE